MVVHCTVYILNITMMINQENGKEEGESIREREDTQRKGWNRG